MPSSSGPIDRRTYLALVGGAAVFGGGTLSQSFGQYGVEPASLMALDTPYQIAPQYYVGQKADRPPASSAEGTIWEVIDSDGGGSIERTISDGKRWLSLSAGGAGSRPGEWYLTPDDGFAAIQSVIDQHAPNVLIRLAPGTYTGSELVLASGVSIVGAGPNATTIRLADGANTDLVRTPSPATRNVMSCSLRDLTLDGNSEQNEAGSVVYGAFWNSRFDNCFFRNSPTEGLWLAGSAASTDDNHVTRCQFIDNRGAGLRGGSNRQSHPAVGVVRVTTSWFGHNAGSAIRIRGNAWKITDSKLYHNGTETGATILIDRSKFTALSGCDSYVSSADGVHVAVRAHSGVDCEGIQIKDNDFRGEYAAGVRCGAKDAVRTTQIRGNVFHTTTSATHGVLADGSGPYVSCACTDNVFSKGFQRPAIEVPAGWAVRDNLGADGQ